jgi:hypothetical protein
MTNTLTPQVGTGPKSSRTAAGGSGAAGGSAPVSRLGGAKSNNDPDDSEVPGSPRSPLQSPRASSRPQSVGLKPMPNATTQPPEQAADGVATGSPPEVSLARDVTGAEPIHNVV